MGTDSKHQDRARRREERAARRAVRQEERVHRRQGLRAVMEQHRTFMDEFKASGSRIKKMDHPLAEVIRTNQRNGHVVEAIRKYFKGLMGANPARPEDPTT